MISKVARHTARVSMAIVGIVLILLAVLTLSARVGLPFLSMYKGDVEARVSDYLKSPVEIGALSLRWEGLGPRLRAQDVAVLESAERSVSLDELLIDLNLAKSLLRGVPIINELTLVGASLAVESDAQGQWRLHGMESVSTARGTEDDKAPGVDIVAWLLNASKVGLLETEVTFIDGRAGSMLVVEDLNIRAENNGDVHQLRVDMGFPDALGGSLEAGIDLVGKAGALSRSDGDLYLRADKLEVKTLSRLLSVAGVVDEQRNLVAHIDTSVSLELWGRWQDGQVVSINGPLSTDSVTDSNTGEVLLTQASAMLGLSRQAGTATLVAKEVLLAASAGETRIDSLSLYWPGDRAAEQTIDTDSAASGDRRTAESGNNTANGWTLEASGEQLSVEAVSALPASLLWRWNTKLAKQLQQSQAGGWVRDWTLRLDQLDDDQPVISVAADLDQLQFASVGSLPGLGPLDGRVDIVDSLGELTLSADSMSLPWPAYTTKPLQLDELKAAVTLDARNSQRIQVGADITLSDGGIRTSTRLTSTLVPGQSPHLDAQSRYSVDDLVALKRWLPRQIMPGGLVRWLDRSLQGGAARNGSLLFFGRLEDFPFHEGEGVFRASVDVEEGRLSFLPTWPVATGINGTLELNGLMLTGRAGPGRLDDFDVTQTVVRIDNLAAPVLQLEGTGRGRLQDVVDFGNTGPLATFLEPVLNDVTGTGATSMDLALSVQLYRNQQALVSPAEKRAGLPFSIDGSLFLNDNSVAFGRAGIALETVTGAIGFDGNGIRINNLRARALEQAVLIKAQTDGLGRQATTNVMVTGSLKGSDVLSHYGNPLDQFLRGTSDWTITLSAPHSSQRMISEGVGLRVRSDLVGTELLLPEPLRKSTAQPAQFELDTAFRTGQSAARWQVRMPDRLHASAWVNAGTLDSLLIQVGSGSLAQSVIDTNPTGIRVQGRAPVFAIDGWVESITDLIQSLPESDTGPSPILSVSAELAIDSLQLGTRVLGPATLRMNTDRTYLNTVLQNASIKGSLRYPREHWSKDTPMKVRIESIDSSLIEALASRNAMPQQNATREDLDPRILPPIDARVGKLVRDSQTLRDVVLRTEPEVSGLRITTLGFAYESMQLVGQGYWRLRDPQGVNPALTDQHTTQLKFVLQADDFGEGLRTVGIEDVISDGEGTVDAQLGWPGPLYRPKLSELDGRVTMDIERGSIVPLEPGAGRMVGLFALQALPRRFELDFKDMTGDGLAFKRISGDMTIDNGIAKVSLVQLTGPIGVVDITGTSDLNRREFDQQITVLPRVSAALPIIGVLSGGAGAGIGALVATGFLKALGIDLDRLGLRDYSLTGTWEEPIFKVIEPDYRRRR